jgi:hypothetical protein
MSLEVDLGAKCDGGGSSTQYEDFMKWTLICRIGRPIRILSPIKCPIDQLILYI